MTKIHKTSLRSMVIVNKVKAKVILIVKIEAVMKKERIKMVINLKVFLKKKSHKINTMLFNKKKLSMTSPTLKESLHHSWPNTKRPELLVSEQSKSLKTHHFIWPLTATHWWTGTHSQSQKKNSARRKFLLLSEGTCLMAALRIGNCLNSKLLIDWCIDVLSLIFIAFYSISFIHSLNILFLFIFYESEF